MSTVHLYHVWQCRFIWYSIHRRIEKLRPPRRCDSYYNIWLEILVTPCFCDVMFPSVAYIGRRQLRLIFANYPALNIIYKRSETGKSAFRMRRGEAVPAQIAVCSLQEFGIILMKPTSDIKTGDGLNLLNFPSLGHGVPHPNETTRTQRYQT